MKKYNKLNGTIFLVIQQINKGGDFVGSKSLEHDTTGMLEMRHCKSGKRYIMFIKNRRCGSMIKIPLYYFKEKATGEIKFDEKTFYSWLRAQQISEENEKSFALDELEAEQFLNEASGAKVDVTEIGKVVSRRSIIQEEEQHQEELV